MIEVIEDDDSSDKGVTGTAIAEFILLNLVTWNRELHPISWRSSLGKVCNVIYAIKLEREVWIDVFIKVDLVT